MQYRRLGKSGLKVSSICLGTLMFGGPTSEEDSLAILRRGREEGINFYDTANIYNAGRAEEVLGKFIAEQSRNDLVVATKGRSPMGPGPNQSGASRKHLMQELHDSLKRLRVDTIDLYYVHAWDAETDLEETLRALDDMVRMGKVQYVACSNFRAYQLCQALWTSDKLGLNSFAAAQPLYNIVNRDIEVELLPLCRDRGVGVVSYSPLARGILSGKYKPGEPYPEGSRAARGEKRMQQTELREESIVVAEKLSEYCRNRGVSVSQFSLAWCLANPVVTSIIVGPRTMEQFEDNLACQKYALTDEDEAVVDGLVGVGEHTSRGFQDPMYPITGRLRGENRI